MHEYTHTHTQTDKRARRPPPSRLSPAPSGRPAEEEEGGEWEAARSRREGRGELAAASAEPLPGRCCHGDLIRFHLQAPGEAQLASREGRWEGGVGRRQG